MILSPFRPPGFKCILNNPESNAPSLSSQSKKTDVKFCSMPPPGGVTRQYSNKATAAPPVGRFVDKDKAAGGSDAKASACNAGDLGSIPGLGRSPGEGNGNPLQYSCLENPTD